MVGDGRSYAAATRVTRACLPKPQTPQSSSQLVTEEVSATPSELHTNISLILQLKEMFVKYFGAGYNSAAINAHTWQ